MFRVILIQVSIVVLATCLNVQAQSTNDNVPPVPGTQGIDPQTGKALPLPGAEPAVPLPPPSLSLPNPTPLPNPNFGVPLPVPTPVPAPVVPVLVPVPGTITHYIDPITGRQGRIFMTADGRWYREQEIAAPRPPHPQIRETVVIERTTIVVQRRRLCERLAERLAERPGPIRRLLRR